MSERMVEAFLTERERTLASVRAWAEKYEAYVFTFG
jgi:hypothetical protein